MLSLQRRRRRLLVFAAGALVAAAAIAPAARPHRAAWAASNVPFRPYIDATLWPPPDVAAMSAPGNGATLGFIVDGGSCSPSWGTYYDVSSTFLASDIASATAAGRSLIVSFGGAANTELASACPTVAATTAAYQKVVDRYGIRSLDFDIEGAAIADAASVARRNQALASLQATAKAAGKPITISYTLPVLPSGLTAEGVALLRSAASAGVDVRVVNLMTMDYGDGPAPNPAGKMGQYAIDAVTSTKAQLASVWPGRTDAQLWAMLGATPMIGQNDLQGEVFTLADAQQLTTWAQGKGLGRLAMWSSARDVPCAGGPTTSVSNLCSSVDAPAGAFAAAFTGTAVPIGTTTSTMATSSTSTTTPAPTTTSVGGSPPWARTITNDWGGGFCADVTVTNPSGTAVTWRVSFDPGGQIGSIWNATASGSAPSVSFVGASWNATLAAGASTTFGYCANRSTTATTAATTQTAWSRTSRRHSRRRNWRVMPQPVRGGPPTAAPPTDTAATSRAPQRRAPAGGTPSLRPALGSRSPEYSTTMKRQPDTSVPVAGAGRCRR